MTKILMIRHASTSWNKDGKIQGLSDVPLDSLSRRDVKTWQLPINFQSKHWISSPLIRAFETAILMGGNPTIDNRLIEMDWGDWEGCSIKDLRCSYGKLMEENESRGLDFRPPRGESPRDLQQRLFPLLIELAKKSQDTVLVTHKGVIRVAIAAAMNWDMTGKAPTKVVSGTGHLFNIDSYGKLTAIELNISLSKETQHTPKMCIE